MSELGLYADEKCTKLVEAISWDEDIILNLIDGSNVPIKGVGRGGQPATATVYIKNNTENKYYIMKMTISDTRLEYEIESAIIEPDKKVKLIVTFRVPNNPTKKDVIENAKVNIDGMFVISR